jgi:hypothetical protein
MAEQAMVDLATVHIGEEVVEVSSWVVAVADSALVGVELD